MILFDGKIYPSSEQDRLLSQLEDEINNTLLNCRPDRERVISASDRLSKRIAAGEFDELINNFDFENKEEYIKTASEVMRRESIEFRINTELSGIIDGEIIPPYGVKKAKICIEPLGVLFHIAAGNVDGLPAFSVLEGLLTGNINILKLPQADNGITVEIFRRLMEEEPLLRRYVYVFDTPSTDITAMEKMAHMADGIAVWGGDGAVKAVRMLAPAGAKLIEWGHKLSFAYISGYSDKTAELPALAKHIIDTRQLFCSSCQTIFLDTDSMEEAEQFCTEFLPYLEAAAEHNPVTDTGALAEMTLRKYNEELENALDGGRKKHIFQGRRTSLALCEDSTLELSYMYGNCLVKRLTADKLLNELRRAKEYLQTAGLICSSEKREALCDILIRGGVNRVMTAGNMSVSFCGEAHDGEYPLRRYTRIVNIEE